MEPYPPAFEDVPANQIFMGKDVRKFGIMKKNSGGKKIPLIQSRYDTRFVIISRGWVYYYKDKTSEKPQGKFSLQGFSNRVINAEEEQAIMPYVFKIYNLKSKDKTWFFATENHTEMLEWMEAFRLEIEQYNSRGITSIRPSKSCPVNPHQKFLHLDLNNGRSKSVRNDDDDLFPHRLAQPHSNVSSCTNVTTTSGIGSSTSSIGQLPDDEYEPIEVFIEEVPSTYRPSHPQEEWPIRDPPMPPGLESPDRSTLTSPGDQTSFSVPAYRPQGFGDPRRHLRSADEGFSAVAVTPTRQFSPLPPRPGTVNSAAPPLPAKPNSSYRPPIDRCYPSMPSTAQNSSNNQHSEQYYCDNYNDPSPLPNYDDNLVQQEGGVYDSLLEDDLSYESPCPDSDEIQDILYEDGEQDKPVMKPLPLKPLPVIPVKSIICQKPAAKESITKGFNNKVGLPKPNLNQNPVIPWQTKLRSPTSEDIVPTRPRIHEKSLADDGDAISTKPEWMKTKLKSTSNAPSESKAKQQWQKVDTSKTDFNHAPSKQALPNKIGSPVGQGQLKPSVAGRSKAIGQPWPDTPANVQPSSGQKPGPPLAVKPKPAMPQKPKNVNTVSSLHNQTASAKPPPPPAKPKPTLNTNPTSSVALRREMFNQ